MNILSLDTATHCGWAAWQNGKPSSGMEEFKLGRQESPGMRFLRFERWVMGMIEKIKPDLISYERSGHFKGAGAAECHHGFQATMHKVAAAAGIPVYPVQNSALKKHTTGKGNAKKGMMIIAARKRWGKVLDLDRKLTHDEADALCILGWALDKLSVRKVIRVRVV